MREAMASYYFWRVNGFRFFCMQMKRNCYDMSECKGFSPTLPVLES